MQTVAWWESRFLGSWQNEYNTYNPRSLSGDEWDIYDMAYPINANYMMFKATGKTEYLDRGLLYTNNLISKAKISSSFTTSQFKDSYLTWVNRSHPSIGNDGREYPLFESYGWRYVTALLYAMKQNPAVYGNTTYRAHYDTILAFTEKNIWEKWYTRSVNSHLYRQNTHMASHWAMIGMYLSLMTTNTTKKAQNETVWKNIAYNGIPSYSGASIQGQLRPNPVSSTAYWWNENWNAFSQPGSDVSHGNAVASFMIESYDLGLYWTASDMTKMANLVKNVIIDTSSYPFYLNNSGSGNGWINDGFAQLGRYDSALQTKIETHSVGQGTTLYGAGALSAKILSLGGATPAVVTNVSVTDITETSARISWNVAPAATGQIAYGQTSSYGSVTTNEQNFLAFHSQTISGLTPNQPCHFNIMGTTANGGTVAPVDRTLMRWLDGGKLLEADWLLEGEKVYLYGRVLTIWTSVRRANSVSPDNIHDEATLRAIVEANR